MYSVLLHRHYIGHLNFDSVWWLNSSGLVLSAVPKERADFYRGVVACGGGQFTTFTQKHGSCKYDHCCHHGNKQTLQNSAKVQRRKISVTFHICFPKHNLNSRQFSLRLTGEMFCTKTDCSLWEQVLQHSPDILGLGVDVSDAIFGQALIHAVEQRPQQATHHPHQDKEGQVHCCPQVAVLISICTLMDKQ